MGLHRQQMKYPWAWDLFTRGNRPAFSRIFRWSKSKKCSFTVVNSAFLDLLRLICGTKSGLLLTPYPLGKHAWNSCLFSLKGNYKELCWLVSIRASCCLTLLILWLPTLAHSEVFYAKDEALALAKCVVVNEKRIRMSDANRRIELR